MSEKKLLKFLLGYIFLVFIGTVIVEIFSKFEYIELFYGICALLVTTCWVIDAHLETLKEGLREKHNE